MNLNELKMLVIMNKESFQKDKELNCNGVGNWDNDDEIYFNGYLDALDWVLETLFENIYTDSDQCAKCGEHIADAHQPTCEYSDEKVAN